MKCYWRFKCFGNRCMWSVSSKYRSIFACPCMTSGKDASQCLNISRSAPLKKSWLQFISVYLKENSAVQIYNANSLHIGDPGTITREPPKNEICHKVKFLTTLLKLLLEDDLLVPWVSFFSQVYYFGLLALVKCVSILRFEFCSKRK